LFVDKATQMLIIPLPAAGKYAKADDSGQGEETLIFVRRAGVDLNMIRHAKKTGTCSRRLSSRQHRKKYLRRFLFVDKASQMLIIPLPAAGEYAKADDLEAGKSVSES